MRNSSLFLCLFVSCLLAGCGSETQNRVDPAQESWVQLFDGETLTGWTPKIRGYEFGDNFAETFRIKDGAIQVAYDGYESFDERFGHLFYEKPFSYYKMAVEYRFTGDQAPGGPGWAFRNSGIMLDQDFPISIEVQLLGGNGTDERSNSNLCTPGTHVVMDEVLVTRHCVNSTSKTYHGDEWVRAEIVVLGDSVITHLLEGEPVLQYSQPQIGGGNVDAFDPAYKMDGQLLTGGYFSLQSESHPIEFRKVELLNLKGCMNPEALNYKSYFLADDPSSCTF